MIRILLTYIVPLLLPAVIYFLWLKYTAGRASPREMPWPWLVGAGLFLALVVFIGLVLLGGEPGGDYVPPHLENGEIVPGHFRPEREAGP